MLFSTVVASLILSALLCDPVRAGSIGISEATTLRALQVVYRHGQKEPQLSYADAAAPKLTNTGKLQMFNLGKAIRRRYDHFLKSNFDPQEVSIVSSDMDRTIQSASLVASGLYREFNEGAKWSRDKKVQFEPIPVRAIPKGRDRYLYLSEPCPLYSEKLEPLAFDECAALFMHKDRAALEKYARATGNNILLNPNSTSTQLIDVITTLEQQIVSNRSQNIPVAPAALELSKNMDLLGATLPCLTLTLDEPEEMRLYSGSMLHLLLDNFKGQSPKKLTAFSGHDRTVTGQLMILNPNQHTDHHTPTGSALFFELHQESSISGSRPYLEIYYLMDPLGDVDRIDIVDCPPPCNLDEFSQLKASLKPINFTEECKI